jgi:hypothetical protein
MGVAPTSSGLAGSDRRPGRHGRPGQQRALVAASRPGSVSWFGLTLQLVTGRGFAREGCACLAGACRSRGPIVTFS